MDLDSINNAKIVFHIELLVKHLGWLTSIEIAKAMFLLTFDEVRGIRIICITRLLNQRKSCSPMRVSNLVPESWLAYTGS